MGWYCSKSSTASCHVEDSWRATQCVWVTNRAASGERAVWDGTTDPFGLGPGLIAGEDEGQA